MLIVLFGIHLICAKVDVCALRGFSSSFTMHNANLIDLCMHQSVVCTCWCTFCHLLCRSYVKIGSIFLELISIRDNYCLPFTCCATSCVFLTHITILHHTHQVGRPRRARFTSCGRRKGPDSRSCTCTDMTLFCARACWSAAPSAVVETTWLRGECVFVVCDCVFAVYIRQCSNRLQC